MLKRVVFVLVAALAGAATASAQSSTTGSGQPSAQQPAGSTTPPQATPPPTPSSGDVETRPATTTTNGDTGLWFVPTGEVLPSRKWSLSAYRVNFDRNQGFSDVSDWPVTFGVGAGNRAEFFGAWSLVRRIERDSV